MGVKKQLRSEPQSWHYSYSGGARVLVIPTEHGGIRGTIAILGDSEERQMALANRIWNLLALSDPCLDKLEVGEPFFVLRGKDATADNLVRGWAAGAEAVGAAPEKVAEARETAAKMAVYPGRRMPT